MGEVKLYLLAENVIVYIKYPKESNKRTCRLINIFIKIGRYKINIEN